jgi:hypothetical protein
MFRHHWTALHIVAIAGVMVGLACDRPRGRSVLTETEVALDQQTLEQLRSAGSDLSKTHTIQFYLYVPSRQDATAAATSLQASDFDTVVKQGADGHNWLCLAQKSMTPTIENLTEVRQVFKALATRYRGEYDGWEAAVEP